jgi:predicted ATPase
VLEDDRFVLYRARVSGENDDVLLKMARADATPDALSLFSSDFLGARRCEIRAIPRPLRIDSTPAGMAFQVREHVPGRSLSLWVEGHVPRPSIGEALQIASLIAEALESLHARGAVHCDVSPRNLLYDAEGRAIYFVDCAFMRGYGATPKVNTQHNPYLAPELSLRESKVDARTDLYSLGVILYQLVVGELPPAAELPGGRSASLAPGLGALFSALLNPDAERRYATAGALKSDLDRYLEDWRRDGALLERAPVLQEPQAKIRFPEQIVGRHAIRSALHDAFVDATRGLPTLVVLTGPSGAGKTTLLDDLHAKARASRALVLRGGFSPYDRDVPLRGLASVCDQLVEWLSTLERRERERVEGELRHALGEGCAILAEAFPVLEQILGIHPPPPAIGTIERRNRLTHCFTSLLASAGRPERPVLLLLEDLQWADAASLPVVEGLPGRAALRNLLTVASIRTGNEGADDAFVSELACAAEGLGQTVRTWQVPPFDVGDTRAFLARTLGIGPGQVEPLAEPLVRMSLGNPLALREILASALAHGDIHFDREADAWAWSLEAIQKSHLRDDVAQILSTRLSSLHPETLSTLRAAACVGRRFSAAAVGALVSVSSSELSSALEICAAEGFIVAVDGDPRSELGQTYQFRHERVQSAAYAGLSALEQARLHAERGQALLSSYAKTQNPEALFDALTHLNRARDGHESSTGREFANLNFKAATLAHHATAYDTAARLLQQVTSWLPDDAWKIDRNLAFDVELLAAECEYLSKRTVAAERAYQQLLARELDVQQRVTTLVMRSRMLCNMGRFEDGAKDVLASLKALGVTMPFDARPAHVVLPMLRTLAMNRHLPARPEDATISELEPRVSSILGCLADLWGPAFWISKNLTGLVVFAMVRLSLTHGNVGASAIGYASYGVFLASELKRLAFGKKVCALGVEVAERAGDPIYVGRARFMYEAFFGYLDEPVREAPGKFRKLVQASLRAGDYPYAGASANMYLYYFPVTGAPLSDFTVESREIVSIARQTQQSRTIMTVEILRRWIQILEGRAQHSVPGFSEDNAFVEGKLNESERGLYHLFEISLLYFLEDYDAAVPHIEFLPGHQMLSGYFALYYAFFTALVEAKRRNRPGNEKRWRQRFRACQRVIAQQVQASPQNLRHLELTLQAIEAATSRTAQPKASALFDAAIQDARQQGFHQNAAIACEWLADHLQALGDKAGAERQLRSARLWYHQWGCLVKVDALDRRGTSTRLATGREALASAVEERWPTSAASVLQAARALSSEADPARLADRLVVSMVESARATRGVLMLREEDELVVACERRLGSASAVEHAGARARDLPELILNYVDRLRRPVHLIASSDHDLFGGDPYMARHPRAAMLTVPLTHMRQSLGVLFLEREGSGVGFSQVDIDTAEILSAQAAATLINQREHSERLAALQDRTHPHFLFNVLTGIAELTVQHPQRAESALLSLSALYRNILGSSTRAQVTLKEELELAESYLNLEKLRFGDRLIHRFDVRGDLSSALVPPLVIQPLLENSVNHGIALRPEGGLVSVEATVSEHRVHVRVSDSGVGWAAGGSGRGSGQGLKSIRKRLQLFFGNDAELLVSTDSGVTVDLFFPRRSAASRSSGYRPELEREPVASSDISAQI